MAANSLPRRLLKKMLYPLMHEGLYAYFQSAAMAWDIKTERLYEPELKVIPYAVGPGDTVIDIGANYGLYVHHLSRALGATGEIYAFEPVPFTFSSLKIVAGLLRCRNVHLVQKGCGDKTAELSFSLPVQESGSISAGLSHLKGRNDAREGREQHARLKNTREVRCEVVALDDYLPPVKNLSFLKCDIEGADLLALKGAKNTIQKHHPTIVCEINPWFLEGYGIALKDLVGFVEGMGYRMYRWNETGPQAGRFGVVTIKDVVEDNYVFVHPDRINKLAPVLAQ